jgi:hypothetical protein
VAGLVFLAYAAILWLGLIYLETKASSSSPGRSPIGPGLRRLAVAWFVLAGLAWTTMLAFWPWAQTRPLRNPIQALQMFSNFWDCMVVFYDGVLACSGQVSRFYLPTWFSLTLPETYLVAFALAAVILVRLRGRTLSRVARTRLWEAAWLAFAAGFPVAWAVTMHTPLYDGLRHFLFVMRSWPSWPESRSPPTCGTADGRWKRRWREWC